MARKCQRIVVIGGGTGLAVLLKGLKKYDADITAIVTVSDDGGSSGRLRSDMGMLPPGDIRNCLVALAETENLMDQVFQYRFRHGEGIEGHNLGNLLLAALTDISGGFVSAIEEVSRVLAVRGRVLPSTLEMVELHANMRDGATVSGETAIRSYPSPIEQIRLLPEDCRPVPASLKAIEQADIIVLGPGSLYTSIIPNLLVHGVSDAIIKSSALKIFVSNIMTEKGETDEFDALQHLQVIQSYASKPFIDCVIVNSGGIDGERLDRYQREEARPVRQNIEELRVLGVRVLDRDLVSADEVAWHDSDKLAALIMELGEAAQ
ncbi:MAG: uridine diphosphate-N-acetylglucosamine-binding protein YvcK [Syntrophomonadaceae bacterium]|nr:uridine diphosphate-N-acetylglucosamine-binding protein YvcK [Syntrophomonadaceae bacterium]